MVEEHLQPDQVREQEEQSPQAIDNARDCGKHVGRIAEQRRKAARGIVGDVEGDADGYRDGHHQREHTREQRAERQRRDPETLVEVGAPVLGRQEVRLVVAQRRDCLRDEERGDGGQQDENEQARSECQPPESPLARFRRST